MSIVNPIDIVALNCPANAIAFTPTEVSIDFTLTGDSTNSTSGLRTITGALTGGGSLSWSKVINFGTVYRSVETPFIPPLMDVDQFICYRFCCENAEYVAFVFGYTDNLSCPRIIADGMSISCTCAAPPDPPVLDCAGWPKGGDYDLCVVINIARDGASDDPRWRVGVSVTLAYGVPDFSALCAFNHSGERVLTGNSDWIDVFADIEGSHRINVTQNFSTTLYTSSVTLDATVTIG